MAPGRGRADDAELAARASLGDEDAASALYERHAGGLLRWLVPYLGDFAAAEDVLQNAFLYLFRSLAEYDPSRASLRTWLGRMALSFARNERRRRRRRPAVSLETPVSDGERTCALGEVIPDTSPERRRALAEALELLATLPAAEREALLLRYVEGLPPRRIAELTGEAPKTVSMRLWRALRRLSGRSQGEEGR
jgi:RNA polymerase sigma-70 factor (ECF subfamily)